MANLRNCAIRKVKGPRYAQKNLRQDMTSHARQQFALDLILGCLDASESDIKKAATIVKNDSLEASAAAHAMYSLRSSKAPLPDPLLSPIRLGAVPTRNIDSDDDTILSPSSLLSSFRPSQATHPTSDTTVPVQRHSVKFSNKQSVRTFSFPKEEYAFVDADVDLPPDPNPRRSRRQITRTKTTPVASRISLPQPNERKQKRKQVRNQSPPSSHQTRKSYFDVDDLIPLV